MENYTEQSLKSSVKGIHITGMNVAMIAASVILYILLTATAMRVSATLRATYQAINDFYVSTQNETLMLEGSDYLTEQARLYVITLERVYADNYFTELHQIRRRETALEQLLDGELGEEVDAYWNAALEKSNLLAEQEQYAMRLAAGSGTLTEELAAVELRAEDAVLTPEEQLEQARDLLLGTGYQTAKQELRENIQNASETLNSSIQITMELGYENFQGAMQEHKQLILFHAIVTAIGFVLTVLLVVFPMTHFIKHIKAREKVRVLGAYECKCLAQTYNVMLAKNEDHEHRLRHQAEHDALTGLLNRGAFDALRQKLSTEQKTVGLLIVDVDKFKQVNDNYGHEMGDQVLRRVAELLTEKFGNIGTPCRVGGDEFSVILTGVPQEKEPEVQAQVEAVNALLTHPNDGLPVVSLSVGGAFSGSGFTDGLYKRADVALYVVKENGRCGCRFYSKEMDEIEV